MSDLDPQLGVHVSWDYEEEECAELGHEFETTRGFEGDQPTYLSHCMWCGIEQED